VEKSTVKPEKSKYFYTVSDTCFVSTEVWKFFSLNVEKVLFLPLRNSSVNGENSGRNREKVSLPDAALIPKWVFRSCRKQHYI
jgi:hypothetical protein